MKDSPAYQERPFVGLGQNTFSQVESRIHPCLAIEPLLLSSEKDKRDLRVVSGGSEKNWQHRF